MVEILKVGKEACSLSGKQADGVWVTFKDGSFTNVFLSWRALRQLIALKSKSGTQK